MLNVMLVGSTDRQLEGYLKSSGSFVVSVDFGNLATLAHPAAKQPDVVVIDLRDNHPLPSATIAAIRRQHAETGVVIVAAVLEPTLLLEALRAGVNEVVADPVVQSDLEDAVSRAVRKKPVTDSGEVFGFVGAKGGVGTTTVAVNVAMALSAIGKDRRSLLIDLHQVGGDAALFVGAEPRFSVVDALDNTHRLDTNLLRSLVSSAGPHLDLLASPERTLAGRLDSAKVRIMIEFVASTYKYTVIDLPRSDAGVLDALDDLTAIIIVANQELATVKSASRLAMGLKQRYGRDKIQVVVSRSDRQADIGYEDVERAIGAKVAHTFPSDYRLALQALNKGRPLALDNHNTLSSSFKVFASQLAHTKVERQAAASRGGFLSRLTQRRS